MGQIKRNECSTAHGYRVKKEEQEEGGRNRCLLKEIIEGYKRKEVWFEPSGRIKGTEIAIHPQLTECFLIHCSRKLISCMQRI